MARALRSNVDVTRIFGGIPLELDVLDKDLEAKYPGFSTGQPIAWGLAVPALPGSWGEHVRIAGVDWSAEFYLPNEFKVPLPRRRASQRVPWRKIRSHCVMIAVLTGRNELNGARDAGRPSVRALLALLRREVPVFIPSNVLWEGAIIRLRKRVRMSAAATELEPAQAAASARLHEVGLKLAKIRAVTMPAQLQRSLEWLTLARSASVRPEKFMHLWLAMLTLASYGQPRRDRDMTRVHTYTATMTHGVGGVRSPLWVSELNQRLRAAYRIRNDLLHRADDSQITPSLLEQLERDAFELIDFEFAKFGTPIPAN